MNDNTDNKLNELGLYFAEHDFLNDLSPIPFSLFEKCRLEKLDFVHYLNAIDGLRAVCVLQHLRLGKTDFRDPSVSRFALDHFASVFLKLTGIVVDCEQLRELLLWLPSSYLTDIWLFPNKEILYENPEVLVNLSLDEFRLIIEIAMSRAAKKQPYLYSIQNQISKVDYPSRRAMEKTLNDLRRKMFDEEMNLFPEKTDFDSMCSIYKSANSISRCWEKLEDIEGQIEELEELIDEWDENPWFSSKTGILYVHRGLVKCIKDNHVLKSVTAIVPGRSGKPCEININYCADCDKFFIDENDFEFYRKKYGLLAAHFAFESRDGKISPYSELAKKSPLKLCGYTVSAESEYSAEERQGLLAAIMDNEIMTKFDILEYLHWFVQYNGSKQGYDSAVRKWKEDISFVREYRIGEQAHCYISEVRQWGK